MTIFLYKNGVLKICYCQFFEVDKTRWSIITDAFGIELRGLRKRVDGDRTVLGIEDHGTVEIDLTRILGIED